MAYAENACSNTIKAHAQIRNAMKSVHNASSMVKHFTTIHRYAQKHTVHQAAHQNPTTMMSGIKANMQICQT